MNPVNISLLLGLVLRCAATGQNGTADSGVLSVCPPFDPTICPLAKPGPAECQNDSQCPQDKKCCCSNCGLMCVTPVQVRPGRCPPILAKCKLPLQDPRCQSDLDCPGKQKCCDICGKSCWDPWKEPAGVCPVNEVQPVGGLQCAAVLCSRDSDCAADENCCLSGDGKKCVKVSSDSGVLSVCPPFDPAICPLAKPGPAGCQNDSQCPQDKKCCCSNCGLMCVTPVQVRPGRCPPILAKCKLPLQDPRCQSDLDCPGKQKCCDICGKSCWDPWKEPEGICPVNEVQPVGGLQCAAVLCSRDSDCAADENCCLSGDGKKCVKVSSDSGLLSVCPPFDPAICPLAKPGPAGCQNDSQCPQDKKCCCSNCGLMCVTPVQVRPGRCPPILAKCKLPLQDPRCQSDLDCPGKQKCCDICGKSCWDPWKEPAGVCPVNEVQPVGGLQCAAVLCSRDSDCAVDEKCCLSGDGKTCVKTFSDVDLLKKGCH